MWKCLISVKFEEENLSWKGRGGGGGVGGWGGGVLHPLERNFEGVKLD